MGAGGGGSASTPKEAPDSLESAQKIKIIDLLCEGEVSGDINLKNILLNDTPIQNKDNTYNFIGVRVTANQGTQDQPYLVGFDSTDRVTSVGVEVKKGEPITRTITDPLVDKVRVTVGVGSLIKTEENGDINGTEVVLSIKIGTQTKYTTIKGKTSGAYNRDVIFTDLPDTPFNIVVTRETADSTSTKLQNKTYFNSYVESISAKMAYPNSVVVGLEFDSDQFGNSVPTRTYLNDWRLMRVPSNYNPVTREYSGVWNGNFKQEWTDNPAWVLFDVLTSKRFGLGEELAGYSVDKWALYAIGRYCDVMVDDGFGGIEPRMTCNVYISSQQDAKQLVDDLASCFRGIAVWDGQTFSAFQDTAKDPVASYSNANVVEGEFQYSGVDLNSIYTAARVKFANADNSYTTDVEYYQNDEGVKRYGLNVKDFTAFGCTSRGQALRAGKSYVTTSLLEQQSITFQLGREGIKHLPGDVIEIADNEYSGVQFAGRVKSVSGSTITADREIEANNGDTLKYYTHNGEMKQFSVSAVTGNQITVSGTPTGIEEFGVFSVYGDVEPRLFRCVSIAEKENSTYTVTGIAHRPDKEAIVDAGAEFDDDATYTIYKVPSLLSARIVQEGTTLKIVWETLANLANRYTVKITRNGAAYRTVNTKKNEITLTNLPYGEYVAVIRAYNSGGQVSDPATVVWSVDLNVSNLRAQPKVFAVYLAWQLPELVLSTAKTEIWRADTDDVTSAIRIASLAYPTDSYTVENLEILEGAYYFARMVDSHGNAGAWANSVYGQPTTDPSPILQQLTDSITQDQLHGELSDIINTVSPIYAGDDADIYAGNNEIYAGVWTIQSAEQEDHYAQAKEIKAVRAQVGEQWAQVTETSQALVDLEGRASAIYGVSVVATAADGTPIVGGLSIGVDGATASSEFLLQADKLMIMDGQKRALFVMTNGKAAINGDLIANGTILGEHIAANQTMSAPKITGGTITGTVINNGSGTFRVDANGNLTAASGTFGGLVSGGSININNNFKVDANGNLTANSGTFYGTVFADNIEGPIMQALTATRHATENWPEVTITAKPYARIALFCGVSVNGSSANPFSVTIRYRGNLVGSIGSVVSTVPTSAIDAGASETRFAIKNTSAVIPIPAHTSGNLRIEGVNFGNSSINLFTVILGKSS